MNKSVNIQDSKMLTKEQLQLGMKVKTSQLKNIYDTYIILSDAEFCGINDVIGVVVFIGDELNAESDKFITQSKTASVYNDSSECEAIVYG